MANDTWPADFLYDNLMIEANVIHAAYEFRVNKAVEHGKELGLLRAGDLIGVLAGMAGDSRSTDVLRVMRVP